MHLQFHIKETQLKIEALQKQMSELRLQFTLLETELIGLKLAKDQMEDQLKQQKFNSI